MVILALLTGLIVPIAAVGQTIDKAVLDRAKDATVYVKVKVAGKIRSAGSGFAIEGSGDKLLILTNRHVVVPESGELPPGARPEVSVVLRSGTSRHQEVSAKLIASDSRQLPDLALLEVQGVKQPPSPISLERLASEEDLVETMTGYSLGFPFGGLIVGDINTNPAVTVNALSISSFRRGEADRLERIQLAGPIIQGNSGGPIIDGKGVLIGVVVERLARENLGNAIPPNVIRSFLAGDVDHISGKVESWSGAVAKLQVEARVVDPLGRVKSMTLRHAPQSDSPDPIQPNALGRWPLIVGGTEVAMPIASGSGSAQFSMTAATPQARKLQFQVFLKDGEGRVIASRPLSITLPDRSGAIPGIDLVARPITVAKWSCVPNIDRGIKHADEPGVTIFDIPESVPSGILWVHKIFNAPCAMVRASGDFSTAVRVENTFDPGLEGTLMRGNVLLMPSSQSAGLLIWQDEKNFVRFELGKSSDGGAVIQTRLLVEVHRRGMTIYTNRLRVPDGPIQLGAVRKGASIRLFFVLEGKVNNAMVHSELGMDFNDEVLVGVMASNLSRRRLQARLGEFMLETLTGEEIAVKSSELLVLVEEGVQKLADGTRVLEGADLKSADAANRNFGPQNNMWQFEGKWSGDRQLIWTPDKPGSILRLELPIDSAGRCELKARFTNAPDFGTVRLDLDGRPLNQGRPIDGYSKTVRPTAMISLGTFDLERGKQVLTITVVGKNPSSENYFFGIDEIQIVPVR